MHIARTFRRRIVPGEVLPTIVIYQFNAFFSQHLLILQPLSEVASVMPMFSLCMLPWPLWWFFADAFHDRFSRVPHELPSVPIHAHLKLAEWKREVSCALKLVNLTIFSLL